MAFPMKLLNDGENVILDLRPHWGRMVGSGLALVATLVIWIWAATTTDVRILEIAMPLITVYAFLRSLRSYLHWVNESFTLTTERVIHRTGVFQKISFEIPLTRVNTVSAQQSWMGRLVASGQVSIEYSGDQTRREFQQFPQPTLIQKEINHVIETLRRN
ncbi:MAG: PH domain-containing protein [Acidimicrobiales bacterium]|jgi:uncharacterized membrane protein YdbT with pleckstrin-like domain|nr:PH domain-containing protein [Acidimicrobiales bacterium]MDP6297818.1 PH domain-containing protein [Acidimicrobiales bacterium]HJM28971.1 PH domain-containing protein [Acidimicrobiales bacterium]HJM97060.1 PH domain-containing protein [Acidimicrobiales bacterium]